MRAALSNSEVKAYALYALLVLLCPNKGNVQVKGGLLEQTVNTFSVNDLSRIDAMLSLAKKVQQPLGIEYAGPELFETVNFTVESTTLRAIVDRIFPSSDGFQVSVQDGVLLINNRNSAEPNALETVLANFSIPKCSILRAEALLRLQLVQSVEPNRTHGYGMSISGDGSEMIGPFTLTHVTVQQALNRIVRDRGAAAWIVQEGPQESKQPLTSDTVERLLDGRRILWTVVDYNSPLMGQIAQITQERVLVHPAPRQ